MSSEEITDTPVPNEEGGEEKIHLIGRPTIDAGQKHTRRSNCFVTMNPEERERLLKLLNSD